MTTQEWETKTKTVTLTNKQWSRLTTFLLMSTNYRNREVEAWEKLSKELNEDGTPTFKNAASNAEYQKDLNADIETIIKIIDNI